MKLNIQKIYKIVKVIPIICDVSQTLAQPLTDSINEILFKYFNNLLTNCFVYHAERCIQRKRYFNKYSTFYSLWANALFRILSVRPWETFVIYMHYEPIAPYFSILSYLLCFEKIEALCVCGDLLLFLTDRLLRE